VLAKTQTDTTTPESNLITLVTGKLSNELTLLGISINPIF